MNSIRFFITFVFCLLLLCGSGYAQQMQQYKQMQEEITKKQKNTRAKINALNQEISKYEERLKMATRKYEQLYQKYKDLKNLIALQDQKLTKLQEEQSQVKQEINITIQSLEQKREELETLIESYKKTLGYLYKHGRTSQLALILSSSSINQMLVRAFYLEKFNTFRDQQAQAIKDAEKELERTKKQLEEARAKNDSVLAEIKSEKEELDQKREQQAENVSLLRQNKEEIQANLQKSKEEANNLENTLASYQRREKEIIEAQKAAIRRREMQRKRNLEEAKKIENDTKRAEEVAKYSEPIDRSEAITETNLEEFEKGFANNKGQLPWPVDSRTISEHFGNRRHPVYGTVTPNLGIEIVTESRDSVHVVHEGAVVDIRPIPGYGDMVFVNHGRFITAYGNLSEIMVRKNDVLQRGDLVGLSGDANSTRGESLFFLIRENSENVDPENWLQMQAVSSRY